MSRFSKRKIIFFNILLSLITFAICLYIADLYFRKQDKQPLFGKLEVLESPVDPKMQEKVDWLSLEIARERGADSLSGIYPLNPPKRTYGRTRYEIEEVKKDYTLFNMEREGNVMKIWNKQFLTNLFCDGDSNWYSSMMIKGHSFLYTFKPFDSTHYPIFRYFPNSLNDTAVNKLRFNDFGWGGDSISLIKPANTIRIAFLGASTTQQMGACDFAYPDYVGNWLNVWAKEKGLNVKFEVINAGRVGLKSMDFRAIMQYEVAPAEPDIVIYYEGRNQIVPGEIACRCAGEEVFGYELLRRSALFRRIVAALEYDILKDIENAKPKEKLLISNRIKISAPDIHSPVLPLNLPQILEDVDSIKEINRRINSDFILCSYAMSTNKRMLEEGLRYASTYSYWMHELGGLRLEDIALLSELQRKVYKSYCEKNDVEFFDVAKELMRLPEAFVDGIHLNCEGMKYHGWIVFLNLLPVVEEHLKNGTLPKPATQTAAQHPYLGNETFERVALPYSCN